jgi:hypothetical protein
VKKVSLVTLALSAVLVLSAPALATGKMVEIGTTAANNAIPWWGSSYNSMRYQCLWFQADIGYAGYIQAIHWNRNTYTTSGTYSDCRVWLCHTTKTALEATFDNNYTGNTPVQVMNKTSFQMPAGPNWVDMGIDPDKFNYNNSNNLLMEIRWNGDGGVTDYCTRSAQANSRIYASDHTATTGSVQNNGQCIRLYIGTMTALEPTSLGRVKTLFR